MILKNELFGIAAHSVNVVAPSVVFVSSGRVTLADEDYEFALKQSKKVQVMSVQERLANVEASLIDSLATIQLKRFDSYWTPPKPAPFTKERRYRLVRGYPVLLNGCYHAKQLSPYVPTVDGLVKVYPDIR